MKYRCTKKNSIFLTAVLVFVISLSAFAQKNIQSFSTADRNSMVTPSGQRIIMAAPIFNRDRSEMTITLSNASDSVVKSGEMFGLTLPERKGYTYDLGTLRWANGKSISVGAPPVIEIEDSFGSGDFVSFTCKLTKNASALSTQKNVKIF